MKEITIKLTEAQEKFLKEFASKHYSGSDANLCTHNPLHLVQTRKERVASDYDSIDVIKYIILGSEGDFDTPEELVESFYEYEECPIEILPFEEVENCDDFIGVDGEEYSIYDENDYFQAYGIDEYKMVEIQYYYDTVAYFFILDEAKRYIEYQRHNLNHPRTFTVSSGYSNYGDFDHFWNLLFGIGEQLNNI